MASLRNIARNSGPEQRLHYPDYGRAGAWLQGLRAYAKRSKWRVIVRGIRRLKRSMDVTFSLTAMVTLTPLFLIVALIIYLQDGGPVMFWQNRVGLRGKEFRFPKFRSMVVDAEQRKLALLADNQHGYGITFKMRRDPRITWIGRIIRKLSIDELPQLYCVLRGDMSLVGPRPPVPNEVARYTVTDRRRLDIKPGLTCIWQVSGRSDLSFEEQVKLDERYIESHSIALDITLLLKTIPAVFTARGAY